MQFKRRSSSASPGPRRHRSAAASFGRFCQGLLIVACAVTAVTSLVLLSSGCKRAKSDVDGIGPYRLGHTTIADSSGACAPYETYTMCSNNGGVAIAGKAAIVDLYFPNSEESSTLTEIVITIKRCNTDAVDAAFRKELGTPVAQVGGRIGWQNSKATIVAQLPAEKDVCEINFLHPSEKERIEKLMPR